LGTILGRIIYFVLSRLRGTGERNLALAFPEASPVERRRILKGIYRHLGWQLAEFCNLLGLNSG